MSNFNSLCITYKHRQTPKKMRREKEKDRDRKTEKKRQTGRQTGIHKSLYLDAIKPCRKISYL